jgi:predicted nuclease of predicted toxin-antitoxin system
MKVKLDENLPVRAAAQLRVMGFDVDTVHDEGLVGQLDEAVWQAAQHEGRFLVTQDLDFSDTRKFAPGSHHGILLVRLPDSEQWRVADYLAAWFADPCIVDWPRSVVVATPHKVRVLRPPVSHH